MSLFDFQTNFTDFDSKEKVGSNGITNRVIKIRHKLKLENKIKSKSINDLVSELPTAEESLHIISSGSFDYFNLIPLIIELSGEIIEEFYFSTWTMSHTNTVQIFDLYDKGIIKKIHCFIGDYFQSREKAVCHILKEGLEKRQGCTFFANKNHAKVSLLKTKSNFYIVEGSANFTANPRIEQFNLTNSSILYNFHQEWMNQLLK